MENKEEKQLPPAYTEQPLPGSTFTPAQTYPAGGGGVAAQPQPAHYYPGGPTQPPLYPPYIPQPAQPATSACVIINSTAQHQHIPVGRDPTLVRCPSCRNDVFTTVLTTPTGRTHMFALLLCLVGCWPCVCIPYCMDSCKASNHYCPVCNAFVGSLKN
ncbi:hypothetical protein ACLKA6_003828 [Drosophila palustris]